MSVWIVTPAKRRYALSAVTLDQHMEALSSIGETKTNVVVVADDFNFDMALHHGCHGVRHRPGTSLGEKFNLGIRYAADNGASLVVPVGSDSFVDLAFLDAVKKGQWEVVTSQNYAIVRNDGKERAHLQMTAVTYALPRHYVWMANTPICDPWIDRGCDTSILNHALKRGYELVFSQGHPLETVAFQTPGNQISDYDAYYEVWGVAKTDDVWDANLRFVYQSNHVDAVRDVYTDMEAALRSA